MYVAVSVCVCVYVFACVQRRADLEEEILLVLKKGAYPPYRFQRGGLPAKAVHLLLTLTSPPHWLSVSLIVKIHLCYPHNFDVKPEQSLK